MTVRELLLDVNLKYPNDVPQEHKWLWLTTLEKQLADECFLTHRLSEEEAARAMEIAAIDSVDSEHRLLAQPPYQDLYVHYLAAQIALVNVDTEEYENEQTLFNNALLTYKNWFSRTHRARIDGNRWRI